MRTMTRAELRTIGKRGGLLGLLCFSLACAKDDANRSLVSGPDDVVTPIALGLPDIPAPPRGSSQASALEFLSFDPDVLDAFGRATEPFTDAYPYWDGELWLFGSDVDGRGWGTADDDPRKPFLTMSAASLDFDFMFIPIQGVFAGSGYDIYGEWCCAPPGERFVVGFERAAIQVNGELDASQVILGQAVTDPDSLFPLGGTPGGDFVRAANEFDTSNPFPAEAGANPFLFGTVMSCPAAPPYEPYDVPCADFPLPDGYVIIDVVISAFDANGNTVWMPDVTPNQSLSVVAPNNFSRHSLPNYNYLTMWHTNPDGSPDFSRPLVRYQLGVDLNPFGGPVNNAFAPFPPGPFTPADLALGKGAESQPDSVTLTLESLKALAAPAVYQAWFVSGASGPAAASGRYVHLSAAGDTLANVADTTSFTGGDGTHVLVLDYPDAAEGRTHVLLSIEDAPSAAQPSARQPMWLSAIQGVGASKTLSQGVTFGTFADGGQGQRVWSISGQGEGNLFGDEVRMNFQHLPRPPVGYQYVGWLQSDSTLERLPDASFTSPPREYAELTNADEDATISDVVLPLEISAATQRFCLATTPGCAGPFSLAPLHGRYVLSLEPKASDPQALGPAEVLIGTLPERSASP